LSLVEVCVNGSLFVHITVSPTLIVTSEGVKVKLVMLIGTVTGNSCGGSTTGSAGRHPSGGVPHHASSPVEDEVGPPERLLASDLNVVDAWLRAVADGISGDGAHPAITMVPTPVGPKTAQQNNAKTIKKRLRVSDSITFLLFE
jgi:hypothetical protein